MPEIYSISQTHSFMPEAKEFAIEPPITGREFIQDVLISFSAEMVFPRAGLPSNAGLNRLRMYFDGKDITQRYLAAVRTAVANDSRSREQYRSGLDRWLKFLDFLASSDAFAEADLQEQRTKAAELRNASWDTLIVFDDLLRFGYQGGMNPFFFFGRDMAMPRVALSEILGTGDEGLDPSSIRDWRLFVSHGPSAVLENANPQIGASFRGVGTITAEYLHEDPWRTQLLTALEAIARGLATLTDQASDIRKSAETAGQRLTAIATLEQSLAGSLETLAELIQPRRDNGL